MLPKQPVSYGSLGSLGSLGDIKPLMRTDKKDLEGHDVKNHEAPATIGYTTYTTSRHWI